MLPPSPSPFPLQVLHDVQLLVSTSSVAAYARVRNLLPFFQMCCETSEVWMGMQTAEDVSIGRRVAGNAFVVGAPDVHTLLYNIHTTYQLPSRRLSALQARCTSCVMSCGLLIGRRRCRLHWSPAKARQPLALQE